MDVTGNFDSTVRRSGDPANSGHRANSSEVTELPLIQDRNTIINSGEYVHTISKQQQLQLNRGRLARFVQRTRVFRRKSRKGRPSDDTSQVL